QIHQCLAIGNERGAESRVETDVDQPMVVDFETECRPQSVRRGQAGAGDGQRRTAPCHQPTFEAGRHGQNRFVMLPATAAVHRYFQCNSRCSSQPAAENSSMTTVTTMKIRARLSAAL